jgi:hypothetical protein
MFKRCYSSQNLGDRADEVCTKAVRFVTISSNMATMQKRPGRLRRFSGWFARHKVLAVFLVLVLGVGAYLLDSWVVQQLQAHREAERYNQIASDIPQIESAVARIGSPKAEYTKYCAHSNFGGVLEVDTIACYAEIKAVYVGINKEDARAIGEETKTLLAQRGLELRASLNPNNIFSVTSYDFTDHETPCYFDTFYYEQETLPHERDPSVPSTGPAALTNITCGGKVGRDYFPVIK